MPNTLNRDIIESVVATMVPAHVPVRTFFGPFYSTITFPRGTADVYVSELKTIFQELGFRTTYTGFPNGFCLDDDEATISAMVPKKISRRK